ncbi:MAG: hypothetical protein ABI461_19830 [Polyangiaceae bacterium]
MLTDAGTALEVDFSRTTEAPAIYLKIDADGMGQLGSKDTPECRVKELNASELAALSAVVRRNAFFSLQNGYNGPTDSGSFHLLITLDGQKKNVGHMSALAISTRIGSNENDRTHLGAVENAMAAAAQSGGWKKCKPVIHITPLQPL